MKPNLAIFSKARGLLLAADAGFGELARPCAPPRWASSSFSRFALLSCKSSCCSLFEKQCNSCSLKLWVGVVIAVLMMVMVMIILSFSAQHGWAPGNGVQSGCLGLDLQLDSISRFSPFKPAKPSEAAFRMRQIFQYSE